jgi:hypothetical protein
MSLYQSLLLASALIWTAIWVSERDSRTFLLALTGLVRDQIIAAGRLPADELNRFSAELRQHLERPDTITSLPNSGHTWASSRKRPPAPHDISLRLTPEYHWFYRFMVD